MASDISHMTFLLFPREIRDMIYTYLTSDMIYTCLTPNEETYSITSTRGITIGFGEASKTDLGIINTCKAIRYEMIEMIRRNNGNNGLRFSILDTVAKSLCHELAPFMTHIELYIDFGTFSWDRFRAGHHDSELDYVSNQVCEILHSLKNCAKRCKSCHFIINDNNKFVSPLLRLRIFDIIKTLVGLETLIILVLLWKSDLRKLASHLAPSLGPSTVHYEWPSLPWAQGHYGCVKFHPRQSLAEKE
ncbi:hypothetical protein IMSHALPRED_008856 [Imshaugia aleurites]|uniref:Uncharacterized protein n=1 Tax=Imshaugia aleurites TaxID=172621 RepID=A0A8H3FWY8_9LECA|nr:hypothetical protein IMSHALPRED_008856 [Imshaugia aleurites]